MKRRDNQSPTIRRAALYIRVSTDEQAQRGYSLPAQKEALDAYAKEHEYAIVDYYIDDGASARKRYTTRKGFMRLLRDVEADKIDVILFIKLDRWFRSIADYYEVQKILDAHNVTWRATQEHYDTETANGRLYTNIKLSIAQDESDRTSDRIKFVFASKVARGEAISGSLPYGLIIQNKRIVPNPELADAVRDMFRHYRETHSIKDTTRYMRSVYGAPLYVHTTRAALSNPLYKGQYRDNPNYCEALIPPEEFDETQRQLATRSVRINPTGRVYIFSGLLRCAECGESMTAHQTGPERGQYVRYRCKRAVEYHECPHHKEIREDHLEEWLLTNIPLEIENQRQAWILKRDSLKKKKAPNRASVLRKLSRLKDLYINDLITLEQYRTDYEKFTSQLEENQEDTKERVPDFDRLQRLFGENVRRTYAGLDRGHKREFWREVISRVVIDSENHLHIFFAF